MRPLSSRGEADAISVSRRLTFAYCPTTARLVRFSQPSLYRHWKGHMTIGTRKATKMLLPRPVSQMQDSCSCEPDAAVSQISQKLATKKFATDTNSLKSNLPSFTRPARRAK